MHPNPSLLNLKAEEWYLKQAIYRTKDETPRRWHGPGVLRPVEVEYSGERVTQEKQRFVAGHSSLLAP